MRNLLTKRFFLVFLAVFGLAWQGSAQAVTGHFAVSGAFGGAFGQVGTGNYSFVPAAAPVQVNTDGTPTAFSTSVGLGYDLAFAQNSPVHDILFSTTVANLSRMKATGNSVITQPGNSPFPSDMSMRSTRFMEDVKLTLAPIVAHIAPYVVAGLGVALNTLNQDVDYGSGNYTRFTSNTQASLAYEVGGGLSYLMKPRFRVSLGYLMTNLGDFSSPNFTTNAPGLTSTSLKTHLRVNQVLLSADWLV